MLVEFTIKNFRSFKDEATLSLEAESLRSEANKARLINTANKRSLLPSVGVFGANGSGKTNIFLALMTLLIFIGENDFRKPGRRKPDRSLLQPFSLEDNAYKSPTLMQVVFWDRPKQIEYRYGFLMDQARVAEEWLYVRAKTNINFVDRVAFRRSGQKFEFGRSFKPAFRGLEKSIRAEDLALPHLQKNNYRAADDFIKSILDQTAVLRVVESQIKQDAIKIYRSDPDISEEVKDIIKRADLSIEDLLLEGPEDNPRLVTIHKRHGVKSGRVGFSLTEQESAGTNQLFHLAVFIAWKLKTGGVLVVDELDSSLHPLLVAAIVNQFNNKRANPKGAQLIYNSNQPYLLSKRVGLRRDQIWFTEKNEREESSLRSLSEYEAHGYEISRNYLIGRFGAVPILRFDQSQE